MNSKKIIIVAMLILSVVIAGCVANSQDNQEIEDDAQDTDEIRSTEEENGIQDVRIVNSEPIKYDNVRNYEVYWDRHNHTSDILKENIGKEVRIYCHYLCYTGELKDVGKFYLLIDDNAYGLMYVDIDQITAMGEVGDKAV